MEMFITQVGGFLASTMLFYMLDLDNSNACGKMQVFQWSWVRATCFMHNELGSCSMLNFESQESRSLYNLCIIT
jgi:hypothetical protein